MLTLLAAAVVFLSDQASKIWIRSALSEEEIVAVIPNCLNITFIRNRGGAFGILPQGQYFFLIISVATIVAIACFYRSYAPRGPACRIAVGLVLGGAVGNLLDRTIMDGGGCVTDWIDVYWSRYHWPAFNVADAAISIGVAILVYILLIKAGAEPGKGPPD